MADEVKEAQAAAQNPKQKLEETPAPKLKPVKVKLRLTGAGSCNYEGIVLRKNETVELEALQAEHFMQSGLFERL